MKQRRIQSMKKNSVFLEEAFCLSIITLACTGLSQALAQEPCPESDGDIGECKVLIEINATDGDIGFHFLIDADDATAVRMDDPNGAKVFEDKAFGPLREQKMTETFLESAEPLCWPDPEADEDEEVVSLRDFLELWEKGIYEIRVDGDDGEKVFGETRLSHHLPAAPADVDFDGAVISWLPGHDLGECAPLSCDECGVETVTEVSDLIPDPSTVAVAAWEVVMEPDVDDGDPIGDEVFLVRISGSAPTYVEVPIGYLMSLPDDTPVKVEVGAIGEDDNATFSEEDGFCVNEVEGCDD